MSKKPTVLMILDGYGLNDKKEGNAVYLAKTPPRLHQIQPSDHQIVYTRVMPLHPMNETLYIWLKHRLWTS